MVIVFARHPSSDPIFWFANHTAPTACEEMDWLRFQPACLHRLSAEVDERANA